MIHTYGDAKKLTPSAYSYPARIVVATVATAFSFNTTSCNVEAVNAVSGSTELTDHTDFSYSSVLQLSTVEVFLICFYTVGTCKLAFNFTFKRNRKSYMVPIFEFLHRV
jgi:hypothetical protein